MAEPKYTLKPEDYFSLWKQFQEDADKVKDKLWTITSWLYSLMSGLMVFLLDRETPNTFLTLFGAGAGVLLSLYTWYMSREFGEHIQNNWDRANRIKCHKIEGLTEILKPENKDDQGTTDESPPCKPEDKGTPIKKIPDFAQRLIYLAIGYGLAFVFIAGYLILFPPTPIKPS